MVSSKNHSKEKYGGLLMKRNISLLFVLFSIFIFFSCSKTTPEEEFGKINALIRQNRLLDAVIKLEDFIDKYPDSKYIPYAKLNLARIHLRTQNYEEALSICDELIKKNNNDIVFVNKVKSVKLNALLGLKKYDDAISMISEDIKKMKKEITSLEKNKNTDKKELKAFYVNLSDAISFEARVFTDKIMNLKKLKNIDKKNIISKLESMSDYLKELSKKVDGKEKNIIENNYYKVNYYKLVALSSFENKEKFLSFYESLKKDKNIPDYLKLQIVQYVIDAYYLANKKPENAEKEVDWVISNWLPDDLNAYWLYHHIAVFYKKNGQPQKAKKFYGIIKKETEKLIASTKDKNEKSSYIISLGDLYYQLGDYKKSKEYYLKAKKEFPNSMPVKLGLADRKLKALENITKKNAEK